MTLLFSELDRMLTEGIILLGYGIALLSILKFIVHQINGGDRMGSSALEDSSFFGGALWDETPSSSPSGRGTHLVPVSSKPPLLASLSAM